MTGGASENPATEKIRLLILDANVNHSKKILTDIRGISFQIESDNSLKSGLARLDRGGIDAVLVDLSLPDSPQRYSTLNQIQAQAACLPIIVMVKPGEESFGIAAVRRGAQDYLVKGEIDNYLLAHTIRLAIARKLGIPTRKYTMKELAQFDGQNGRPSYIAFKRKVFDVSGSSLFKNGKHQSMHAIGTDLTQSISQAPHGEALLFRFSIVGEIVEEATLGARVARRIEHLHPHPIIVHFSEAYSIASPLLFTLYLISGSASLEAASFYLLIMAAVSAPICALSGYFSWKVSFLGKPGPTYKWKIYGSLLLIALLMICVAWRSLVPGIGAVLPWRYLYFILLLSLIPLVGAIGYRGGRLVYS